MTQVKRISVHICGWYLFLFKLSVDLLGCFSESYSSRKSSGSFHSSGQRLSIMEGMTATKPAASKDSASFDAVVQPCLCLL